MPSNRWNYCREHQVRYPADGRECPECYLGAPPVYTFAPDCPREARVKPPVIERRVRLPKDALDGAYRNEPSMTLPGHMTYVAVEPPDPMLVPPIVINYDIFEPRFPAGYTIRDVLGMATISPDAPAPSPPLPAFPRRAMRP